MINISRLELFEKLQQVVGTEKIPDIMKILDDYIFETVRQEYGSVVTSNIIVTKES